MNVGLVIVIGCIAGFLDGVGIFFQPKEPYTIEILFAAISLTLRNTRWQACGFGLLYGSAFALVIFLAKGGFKSKDAPYVIPSGVVLGLLTGLAIWKFGLV